MKNKIEYITLYHYTDKKISGKLTPRYFGDNLYTSGDCRVSPFKRLFFYDIPKPEAVLHGSRFLYTCRIAKNKIYDLIQDKSGYLKKNIPHTDTFNFTAIFKSLKNRGFKGIKYNIGGTYNVICLFCNITPLKIEVF
jgi:hypothetical protein